MGALAGLVMLAAAWAPAASAGTAQAPEISDPVGDASPLVSYVQLPKEAAVANHTELVDISKAYVQSEDGESFTLRIHVADLPDEWILPTAPINSGPISPLPPVALSHGQMPQWDDKLLNNKVNLTFNFTIRMGAQLRTFQAVASLAELNLENPNQVPRTDTRDYINLVMALAHAKLMDTKRNVTNVAPINALGTINAKLDEADGHLADAQELVDSTCVGPPANLCAKQELCSSIAFECRAGSDSICLEADPSVCAPNGTLEDLAIELIQKARDNLSGARSSLAPHLAPLGQSVSPSDEVRNLISQVDGLLNATHALLNQAGLWVSAGTGSPLQPTNASAQPPKVLLFHRLALLAPDGSRTPLDGAVDLKGNFVQMRVPKAAVGSPGAGHVMTKVWAYSAFKGVRMDYAPDAANLDPLASPQAFAFAALGGGTVVPTYGKDYVFLHNPPASTGPGGPNGERIQLSANGPTQQEIAPGGVATYYVTIRNVAAVALEGVIVLSPPAPGWTTQMSASAWSLGPGASDLVTVTVSGVAGGAPAEATRMTVAIAGAESQYIDLHTGMKPGAGGSTVDGGSPGGKSKKRGFLPGFEAVALVAALGAALAVAARRRKD